jgi:hypothetical protein
MAGLVPAIHAGVRKAVPRLGADDAENYVEVLKPPRPVTAWMAGTSPAMTLSRG